MSHTLTEVISFDPSLVVPDILDTDYPTTVPQGVQALGNRTQFLLEAHNELVTATNAQADALDIVRSRATFAVGTGTPGGLYALTKFFDGTVSPGSYSLSSNRIHVPFAGLYRITFNVYLGRNFIATAASNNILRCFLYLGESIYRTYTVTVPSTESTSVGQITVVEPLTIVSAASQQISLRPFSENTMPQTGTLDLQRLQ